MRSCPYHDGLHASRRRPRPRRLGKIEAEWKMPRVPAKRWTRVATAVLAAVLAVPSCSTGDTDTPLAAETEITTTTAAAAPGAVGTDSATAESAPTTTLTTTNTTAQPTTTTTAAPPPAPDITIWSNPRLRESRLTARWQVTPSDTNCAYDLLSAEGEVIGAGVAAADPVGDDFRHINEEYDPATYEAVGSVIIRCSVRGGTEAVAEHSAHRVVYQNRHPDSVFPATDERYFDHDEVRALFPDCTPGIRPYAVGLMDGAAIDWAPLDIADKNGNGWVSPEEYLDAILEFWPGVYENWDIASRLNDSGYEFATGWWTTRQLRLRYPSSTLTTDNAHQSLGYFDAFGRIWGTDPKQDYAGSPWEVFPYRGGRNAYFLKSLYLRLNNDVGYTYVADGEDNTPVQEIGQLIKDTGLSGNKPNPPRIRVKPEDLLWDWMDHRYFYAPVDREPTAWAMKSLLEVRSSKCIATTMREHCESGDFHRSPHMRHPDQGGSRLGSVLWSLICPEIEP